MYHHPAISQELAKARIADWRRQAEREARARAVAPVPSNSPRAARKRIPVGFPGWRLRQPAQQPSR
jgi:hypothetical protein